MPNAAGNSDRPRRFPWVTWLGAASGVVLCLCSFDVLPNEIARQGSGKIVYAAWAVVGFLVTVAGSILELRRTHPLLRAVGFAAGFLFNGVPLLRVVYLIFGLLYRPAPGG